LWLAINGHLNIKENGSKTFLTLSLCNFLAFPHITQCRFKCEKICLAFCLKTSSVRFPLLYIFLSFCFSVFFFCGNYLAEPFLFPCPYVFGGYFMSIAQCLLYKRTLCSLETANNTRMCGSLYLIMIIFSVWQIFELEFYKRCLLTDGWMDKKSLIKLTTTKTSIFNSMYLIFLANKLAQTTSAGIGPQKYDALPLHIYFQIC